MQEIHALSYFSCVEIFLGSLAFHTFRPFALVDSQSLSLSLYASHTRFCLFFKLSLVSCHISEWWHYAASSFKSSYTYMLCLIVGLGLEILPNSLAELEKKLCACFVECLDTSKSWFCEKICSATFK